MRNISLIANKQAASKGSSRYQKLIAKGLIVLAVSMTAGVNAMLSQQSVSDHASKSADDLSDESLLALRDKREELVKQIDDTERALRDLQTSESWLKQEEDLNKALQRKQKSGRLADAERTGLEKKIDDARTAAATESSLEQVQGFIKQKQAELDDKRKRRSNIDAEMNRRIDLETPKQKFKTSMSTTFAVLVGLVILGFFAVAFFDENVRREIFSGTAGIQFVTLFSLVIAIILFGITGILEGKELAALLGGLSGYILGRAGSTRSE
ncbi:MAG TPA: hypothetical protein VJ723_07570 [Candidatus Angelobacter sp.]|nr:hypothetical protein [Candidatus Angelobacter sp.]